MLVIYEKMKDRKEVNIFNLWNIKKSRKPADKSEHDDDHNSYADANDDGLLESDNESGAQENDEEMKNDDLNTHFV